MKNPTQVNAMLSSARRQAGPLRSQPATRIPSVCVVDTRLDDYQGWESRGEAHSVRLHFVTSAAEALRLSRTTEVDLWVVNTELPGLSGCELCGMLKSQRAGATVYLVADHYSPETERAAWAARATMFGCKPQHQAWIETWLGLRRNKPTLKLN